MNKSDKYYLKQGRLELSMLDEEDNDDTEEKAVPADPNKRKQEEMLSALNIQHTKRLRGGKEPGEPKVKVSKEIYSTLHAMGQYLTKSEEGSTNNNNSLPVKKPVNTAKAQLLEQLASTVKVQSMELPPLPSKEERMKNITITKADEIKDISADANIPVVQKESSIFRPKDSLQAMNEEQEENESQDNENFFQDTEAARKEADLKAVQEVGEASAAEAVVNGEAENNEKTDDDGNEEENADIGGSLTDNEQYSAEMDKEVASSYEKVNSVVVKQENENANAAPVQHHPQVQKEAEIIPEFKDEQSVQREVDELVSGFFPKRTPQYSFTKDLKRHIDKHIRALRQQG